MSSTARHSSYSCRSGLPQNSLPRSVSTRRSLTSCSSKNGRTAAHAHDLSTPNPVYFERADSIINLAAASGAGSSVAWPLQLSTQGKYLEQQNGEPFLLVADAGWEFMTQLTEEEAVAYLDDRKTKGFNAVEIRVIGRKFQTNAPNDF